MNIYPVQMNCLSLNATNFKANFVHNEISRDLINSSSEADVAEFNSVCESLKLAKKDQRSFLLAGVTSGYGVCAETEVEDKFIDLSYKTMASDVPNFIRSWIIRSENIVSGGFEKKNILKEITKSLKNIAAENAFHSVYNPETVVIKKATYISKFV